MKRFVFLLLGIFFIGLVSASSIAVWQGQYYTGTTFNPGIYSFNFTVYDSLTGGTVCFTNTTSLTTGNWGEWKTEQSPWTNCNNASREYFLNINIDSVDQTSRRRLVVSDFLRKDVSETQEGNLVVEDNITADYYFGNGSQLTGLAGGEDNSSWNESYADTLYYLIANPFGFYNSTDFLISNYFTSAQILGFNYSNSTDFSISDYYLKSNPFGFWNNTYATFNETYADTKYLQSYVETDPLWGGNLTNVAFTNIEEIFEGNITTEGILLEQDTTNHRIYDNSTCVIIKGDTSTMYIC